MMKKLYEFSAMLQCHYVVAADSEEAARKAIETYERARFEEGDFIGVSDVTLDNVREVVKGACLEDLAHEVL